MVFSVDPGLRRDDIGIGEGWSEETEAEGLCLALAGALWHIPRPNNKRTGRFWPASKG